MMANIGLEDWAVEPCWEWLDARLAQQPRGHQREALRALAKALEQYLRRRDRPQEPYVKGPWDRHP